MKHRIRRSAEEWKRLFVAQEQSGLGVVAFCQSQGIHPVVWYKKRKELELEGPVRSSRFVAVRVRGTEEKIRIEVGGVVIHTGLRGVSALAQVVATVGGMGHGEG